MLDPAIGYPNSVRLLGSTNDEALIVLGSWEGVEDYLAIVDLRTSCVTRTLAGFRDTLSGGGSVVVVTPEQEPAGPIPGRPPEMQVAEDTTQPLHTGEIVPLLLRFGARTHDALAFDASGRIMLSEIDDRMQRSFDGGRTFSPIDGNASYNPMLTEDGSLGVYRRCERPCGGRYRLALLAMSSGARPQRAGRSGPWAYLTHFLSPDGLSVITAAFDEEEATTCVERIETRGGRITELGCYRTDQGGDGALAVSPNHRWGALLTTSPDEPPSPTNRKMRVLDLTDGRVVAEVPGPFSPPPVLDDRGLVAWAADSIAETRVAVTSARGTVRLGLGMPLGWTPDGRLIVENYRRMLGNTHRDRLPDLAAFASRSACGIVEAVPVTPP